VRYEDVVAKPADAFGAMLAFAGLRQEETFNRALAKVRFGSERTQAFRRDLGEENVAALSRSLAGHLGRRGYQV
jgi:hypothetical protein